ncbi:hypothetical protein ACKVWC_011556 [Pyricularia oryzae]
MVHAILLYCHTLENKSSLPPNPAAGLAVPPDAFPVPVLLAHPPNSSSAATLGWKPPEAPGTMLWLAKPPPPLLPQPPKASELLEGMVVAVLLAGAAAASGVDQASLAPQTSEFDQLLVPIVDVGLEVAGGDLTWVEAERLKTESELGAGAALGLGVEVWAGVEKSKRSPSAAEAGIDVPAGFAWGADVVVAVGEVSPPKPLELPNDDFCW